MALHFKKSVSGQMVMFGPMIGVGGTTVLTSLVMSSGSVLVHKSGGLSTGFSAAGRDLAHTTQGIYALTLATTDIDTYGDVKFYLTKSTQSLAAMLEGIVMNTSAHDALYAATGGSIEADVVKWNGTAPATSSTAGVPVVDTKYVTGTLQTANDNGADINAILVDTADMQPKLGTPAGTDISADVAAVKADTAAVLIDTSEIGLAGAGLTNINLPNQTMDITGSLSGSVGSVTGAVGSVTGSVGSIANAPANWSSLVITVGGAVDSLVQGYLNTLIAETTAGRIAANFDNFYDNANALTTKVVDDVGTATAATDWTATEKENIRYRLGVNGTQTAPTSNAPTLPIRLDAQGKLDVNAECDTAIVDGALATAASQTTTNNHLTDIKGATWSALTDSLEKIRDRGDSAWATAVGFSTHTAASVWSVVTRVLTAGTNIALAKGTGLTGLNDLSAAQVNAEVDTALNTAIPTSPIAGSANDVLQSQARSAGTIQDGAAVAGTLSTTFMTTDLTVSVADQYNGRIIIFANDTTTAALRGQATDITSTTVTGSKLGFTALTSAPVAGDTFVVV